MMLSKMFSEFLCFVFSLWASLTVFMIGVSSMNYFSIMNPDAGTCFMLCYLIGVLLLTYFPFNIIVHYLREDTE